MIHVRAGDHQHWLALRLHHLRDGAPQFFDRAIYYGILGI